MGRRTQTEAGTPLAGSARLSVTPARALREAAQHLPCPRGRIKDGDFPPPVRLGGPHNRAIGWRRSEVHDWIAYLPRSTEIT